MHNDRNACACMRVCVQATVVVWYRITGMARAASVRYEKALVEEMYGDYFLIYMEEDAGVLKNHLGR